MAREDVVHVLRRFTRALARGGALLDLQVVPPEPVLEAGGEVVCAVEGGTLLADAAAATAVVDDAIRQGRLREESVDDHDVLRHFANGAAVVEHFRTRERSVPAAALPRIEADPRPYVMRERCRLRRLARA